MINIWSDENNQGEYSNGQGETLRFMKKWPRRYRSDQFDKELGIIMVIKSSYTSTGQNLRQCVCGQVVWFKVFYLAELQIKMVLLHYRINSLLVTKRFWYEQLIQESLKMLTDTKVWCHLIVHVYGKRHNSKALKPMQKWNKLNLQGAS